MPVSLYCFDLGYFYALGGTPYRQGEKQRLKINFPAIFPETPVFAF